MKNFAFVITLYSSSYGLFIFVRLSVACRCACMFIDESNIANKVAGDVQKILCSILKPDDVRSWHLRFIWLSKPTPPFWY